MIIITIKFMTCIARRTFANLKWLDDLRGSELNAFCGGGRAAGGGRRALLTGGSCRRSLPSD